MHPLITNVHINILNINIVHVILLYVPHIIEHIAINNSVTTIDTILYFINLYGLFFIIFLYITCGSYHNLVQVFAIRVPASIPTIPYIFPNTIETIIFII